MLEAQLAAQRNQVLVLRSDLEQAEGGHGELVRRLHDELPSTGPPSDSASGTKLCLEDLLDEKRFSQMFDLD
eukprot:3848942-Pyramimonas_sp.AAC.1